MSREIAVVAVFGDLGRSPRMINHARELLKSDFHVNIIGYNGDIDYDIASSHHVNFHFVHPFNFSDIKKNHPMIEKNMRILFIFLRILFLGLNLVYILGKLFMFSKKSPKVMIIQTPPVLPLLFISPLFCLFSGTKLIVDWHNFGYTLIDKKHWLLRKIYQIVEYILGRVCSLPKNWRYICVSNSMKNWISRHFKTDINKIDVLYDRPNGNYRIFSEKERQTGRKMFFDKFNIPDENSLIFVSSTSWTPDENFDLMLDALLKSDQLISQTKSQKRNIVLVITGKGPLRKSFEDRVKFMNLKHFRVVTAWLENEAYPRLLSCSDLGISLHTSSSGLDLPMKIVDMLGSGLPVCSFKYECLSELLKNNKFGILFRTSDELAQIMANISTGKQSEKMAELRLNIASDPLKSWSQEWGRWSSEKAIKPNK